MRRGYGILLVALVLSGERVGKGDDGGGADRRARAAAHVGSTVVTVGEVEDRIAALPAFQRATFGATADAVRHRFLADVLVHDALLTAGAKDAGLGAKPPAAYEIERAYSASTIRAVRAEVGPAAAIPMKDVEQYYAENRARYDAPERYQLWRILTKTRADAQAVLDAAHKDPTPAAFATLARERSLDKATNLRSGNLGFVTAEGTSNEPGLRVDPAVVRAAQTVRDGALVPQPVAEGDYFAVVWRRGTIAATKRSPVEAAAQIRDTLWKRRVKDATDALLAGLRKDRVKDLNAGILSTVDIPPPSGQATARH